MRHSDHIIEQAAKLNHKVEVLSNIKSGKEATVYTVLLDGHLVAMKVYKKPEERSFQQTGAYLLGKHYRRPSQQKAVAKKNAFAKKLKQENWVTREFFLLQKLFNRGARIPKPFLHIEDAVLWNSWEMATRSPLGCVMLHWRNMKWRAHLPLCSRA